MARDQVEQMVGLGKGITEREALALLQVRSSTDRSVVLLPGSVGRLLASITAIFAWPTSDSHNTERTGTRRVGTSWQAVGHADTLRS